jgi:hypothetical protein
VLAIVGRELASEAEHLTREWDRLDALLGVEAKPMATTDVKQAIRARTERLSERIRRGDADAGPFRQAVLDHVRCTVIEKLTIDNPKLVPPTTARS